jgi:hypothetical protein
MVGHGFSGWWQQFVWSRWLCACRSIFPEKWCSLELLQSSVLSRELFGESVQKLVELGVPVIQVKKEETSESQLGLQFLMQ